MSFRRLTGAKPRRLRLSVPSTTASIGWLALLVPLLQPYSFPIVVPMLIIAAVAVLLREKGRIQGTGLLAPRLTLACLAALSVWALASTAWAIDVRLALATAMSVIGAWFAGIVLLDAMGSWGVKDHLRFERFLLLGFLLGIGNLQFMLLTDGALKAGLQVALKPIIGPQRADIMPTAVDSSMTLIALLAWPALRTAWRSFGGWAALGLYGLGLAVILQGASTTALIAYLAAALVFVAGYALPRATIAAGGAALIGILLFAPVILKPGMTDHLSPALALAHGKQGSMSHRQQIWGFVIDRIGERPWLGWGMGNSRLVPGAHDEFWPGAEHIPLHPHDGALQLRLELGWPGTILGAAGFAALIWSLLRLLPDRLDRACAAAALAVAAIHALVSYSLWHEWWITFLILTFLFLYGASSRRHSGALS